MNNINIKNLTEDQISDLESQIASLRKNRGQKKMWASNWLFLLTSKYMYKEHINTNNIPHNYINWDWDIIEDNYNPEYYFLSFQTNKQATKFRDKLVAMKEIWTWYTENETTIVWFDDLSKSKYTVYYNYDNNCVQVTSFNHSKYCWFLPVYSSFDLSQKATKELTSQYKIIFDIDE